MTFEPRRLRVATTDAQGKSARRAPFVLVALFSANLTPLSSCRLPLPPAGQEDYTLDLALHGEVVPGQSRYEVLGTKVEVKLRKQEAQQWPALEQGQPRADAGAVPAQQLAASASAGQPASAPPAQATPAYPYAG